MPSTAPLSIRRAALRLEAIHVWTLKVKAELELLADALNEAGLVRERDHLEAAAQECDYAADTLGLIVRGDD